MRAESDTAIVINSQGLREDHEIGPPQPDTTRLLCVGDSFTFGYGVEGDQAYPHLLSRSRAGADGNSIESINGGVMGYGTDNEVAWLKKYGWQLQPGIVIVDFYVGNDVHAVILGVNKTNVNGQGNWLPTGKGLLFKLDTHWNPKGRALGARLIGDGLAHLSIERSTR